MVARLIVLAMVGFVATARAQSIGSVTAGPLVGAQVGSVDREAVLGANASFGFEAGPWFLGPEFALVRGATTRTRVLGLVARVTAGGGRVRPFLVGGAGTANWSSRYTYQLANGESVDDWSGVDYFSGSFGFGVDLGRRAGLNTRIEARHHAALQRDDISRRVVTLGMGFRYSW